MNKITVLGHFGGTKEFVDGQTVKTKMLTQYLKQLLGNNEVETIDTYGWKTKPYKLLYSIIKSFIQSRNIVILTAHNGLKIFIPLCVIVNYIFKRKLHYSVIGGWLPNYLEANKWLTPYLKKFNCIYVETKTMKRQLEKIGFSNVYHIPNFKKLKRIKKPLLDSINEPYRLCTFSRVNKQKGIADLCIAVEKINKKNKKLVFTVDVYGPIEEGYTQEFEQIKLKYSDFMKYKGIVDSDKSVDIISKYYMLVFPTKYKTEGIPGTIIDAYSSGVPVLASKWQSYDEVVKENITGIGYKFDDLDSLVEKLEKCRDEQIINNMRQKCIEESKQYTPEYVMSKLIKHIK